MKRRKRMESSSDVWSLNGMLSPRSIYVVIEPLDGSYFPGTVIVLMAFPKENNKSFLSLKVGQDKAVLPQPLCLLHPDKYTRTTCYIQWN